MRNGVNWKLIIALTVFFGLLACGFIYKGTDHYATETTYYADITTVSGENLIVSSAYPIKTRRTRYGTITVTTNNGGAVELYSCVKFRKYCEDHRVLVKGNFKK